MKESEIQDQVYAFISEELMGGESGLDENTLLLELGILDSLKMTELVAFIEERFEITLMPEDVSFTHFKNIKTISQLIHERCHEQEIKAA